jgi:hypothetical protein
MTCLSKSDGDDVVAAEISTKRTSYSSSTPPPPDNRREREEMCFGVPKPWFLPFVGLAIVLIGVFSLLERVIPGISAWPIIFIILGILIIVAALSRQRR